MNSLSDPALHRAIHAVDDSGKDFLTVPDYVKQASAEDLQSPDPSKPRLYADPVHLLFPCHTKVATWRSALDLYRNRIEPGGLIREKNSEVDRRLEAAAKFHGIANDVAALKASYEKDAASLEESEDDADYGLVIEKAAGVKHRHLPIRNEAEVKAAEDYLYKYRDRLKYPQRHSLANKVLEKAAELGCAIEDPEALWKLAGKGSCPPSAAAELLYKCAKVIAPRHKAEAAEMVKIAINLLEGPPEAMVHPDNLVKVATLVDTTHRYYKLPASSPSARPEEILFCLHPKTAADVVDKHCQLTTGSCYEKSAFNGLPIGRLRDVFGDDFVDAVSTGGVFVDREKLATLVETLPRGDAEAFERLTAECGIAPVYQEKLASGPLSSAEGLAQMAAEHRSHRQR